MKACFKCGETKPLSEFYKHPATADGYLGKCKACAKAYATANRLKNIDHYRAYDLERAKIPERAAAAAEISKAWRHSDKRIDRCHNAVTRAVKSGRLERKPCERCSSEKSLAHHESYDRPLTVAWLCQPCHKQRHKEMKLEGVEP